MNSIMMKKSSNGIVYEVTIEKDKTFWMSLFRKPSSVTYGLRNRKWYNETHDRNASFSEVESIELEIAVMEYNEIKHKARK